MDNNDFNKMMEEMQKQALALQEEMMKTMNSDGFAQMQENAMEQIQSFSADLMDQFQTNELDFDYEEDDSLTEEELAQFIEEHKVPVEYEKYMPIGAVLIGMNGEPYPVLNLLDTVENWNYALETGWGIDDRKSALDKIEWLLNGGHANVYNEDFVNLQEGKKHDFSADDIEDYEACIEGIVELLQLDSSLVKSARNLAAWDYERVGYLARIFVHVGYITEEEAWDYFKRAGKLISSQFHSWEEYFISIIFGRCFPMGLNEGIFAMSFELLNDARAFLDSHPIDQMQ